MDSYVYGKNTVEFVTVCVEFCSFVENASQSNRENFVDKASKLLPLLYLKASLITPQEVFEDYPERFVSEEMYNDVKDGIERILGKHDTYLEVFMSEMQYSDTPIAASMSEDFADIWQCVKDFILVYEMGNEDASRVAITDCIESFREYWGQKIVNVMRPLHAIMYTVADGEDDKNDTDFENIEDEMSVLDNEERCECEDDCECEDGKSGCNCRHKHR